MKKSYLYLLIVCTAVGMFVTSRLSGQTYTYDPRYMAEALGHIGLESSNPTAIGIRMMPDFGTVRLTGSHSSGKLHRTMESGVINGWGFGADSYKSLKHLNLWGDFTFVNDRHNGRRWSDNWNPYNGNPYQAGSEIPGTYVGQRFDMGVKISSKCLFKRVWFGLGFDYKLGDLSRAVNPRSRVQLADLALIPGFTVRLADKHLLGLNFTGQYRKEKNNRYVIKSDHSNDFLIWRQEGLGVYSTIDSERFERRMKTTCLGGELQYGFWGDTWFLHAEMGWKHHKDRIEDKIKESPGDYRADELLFRLDSRWHGTHSWQRAGLAFDASFGTSMKFFQKLHTETNPENDVSQSWYTTLLESKAFTHQVWKAVVDYGYYRLDGMDILWSVLPEITLDSTEDRYCLYVPASVMRGLSASFSIDGSLRLLEKGKHRLYAGLGLGYRLSLNGDFILSPELEHVEMVDSIYRPDYELLTADIVSFCLKLEYIFPLSKQINGFVNLEGRELVCTSAAKLNRHMADISLGILRRF